MSRDVDQIVTEAQEGTKADKESAKCAAKRAKVARQPAGSTRRKIAERELARCLAAQSTDAANE
jgi:hypothetical protein